MKAGTPQKPEFSGASGARFNRQPAMPLIAHLVHWPNGEVGLSALKRMDEIIRFAKGFTTARAEVGRCRGQTSGQG
jgi:hypothetical protein